jgi:uncharacterized lipoprotein YajG
MGTQIGRSRRRQVEKKLLMSSIERPRTRILVLAAVAAQTKHIRLAPHCAVDSQNPPGNTPG